MKRALSVSLSLSLASSLLAFGCGGSSSSGDDDGSSGTFDGQPGEFHSDYTGMDGVARHYVMSVPASYSSDTAVPLLVVFYGACKSAEEFYMKDTVQTLKAMSATSPFIIVVPDSTVECGGDPTCRDYVTAAPSCSAFDSADNILAQMDGVVDLLNDVATHYNIDPTQIHAIGHSNGALFTGLGGLDQSEYYASLLMVSNGWGAGYPIAAPTRKIPIQFVCGGDDTDFCNAAQGTEAFLRGEGFETRMEVNPGIGHSFDDNCAAVGVQSLYDWMHAHPLPAAGSASN